MFYLFIFAFAMTIVLWILAYQVKFFRKQIKIYGTLFTILSMSTLVYVAHDYKDIWLPKIEKIWAEEKVASAIEVSAEGDGVLNPLDETILIQNKVQLKAPLIQQMPELPRGCEVTSLAMLLQYNGYEADKMKLAKQIKKDTTPYQIKNGKIIFGNPYDGFVGSMYSFGEPGYGVYHKPLTELAKQYAIDDNVMDLTGQSFFEVIRSLNKEQPVLVIINAQYKKLPESAFQTWHTPSGEVKITMREHSVLVTGYDENYIYFNDPLNKQSKAPFDDFVAAWEQMGKQAITIEKDEMATIKVGKINSTVPY